jgi:hypothetical protein
VFAVEVGSAWVKSASMTSCPAVNPEVSHAPATREEACGPRL